MRKKTKLSPGLEGFNYNVKNANKLGEHLEQFFQGIIDSVRASDWWSDPTRGNYQDAWKDLAAKLNKKGGIYFKQLDKIFREDIGMGGISDIDVYSSPAIYPMGSPDDYDKFVDKATYAYVTALRRNGDIISDLQDLIYNESGRKTQEYCAAYINLWEMIGESFDPESGRFSVIGGKYAGDIEVVYTLKPTICMGLNRLFFYSNDPNDDKALTARELTAIYLHEIGHSIDTFVRIADTSIINNLVVRSGKSLDISKVAVDSLEPDVATIRKLITVFDTNTNILTEMASSAGNKAEVTKLSKYKDLIKRTLESAANVCEVMDMDNSGDKPEGVWATFKYVMWIIITLPFRFLIRALLSVIITGAWYKYYSWLYDVEHASVTQKQGGTNFSQTTMSTYRHNLGERSADSYATRLGYGADIISSLTKMFDDDGPYGKFVPHSGVWVLDWVASICSRAEDIFSIGNNLPSWDIVHREGVDRIDNILNQTYRFFRMFNKNECNPEFYERMMNSVKKLTIALDKAKKTYVAKNSFSVTQQYAALILTVDGLLDVITTGRMAKDYDLLDRRVARITDNSFHYWSSELEK